MYTTNTACIVHSHFKWEPSDVNKFIVQQLPTDCTGNWSPSDFPSGEVYPAHAPHSVNRDLLVAMEGEDIVNAFYTVFQNDWAAGTEWEPKYC